jgi:hypothetical protein
MVERDRLGGEDVASEPEDTGLPAGMILLLVGGVGGVLALNWALRRAGVAGDDWGDDSTWSSPRARRSFSGGWSGIGGGRRSRRGGGRRRSTSRRGRGGRRL